MSLFNQTNATNFVLEIPDAGITKSFKLNVQSALVPGIRIPSTNTPAGTFGKARSNIPGSTLEFDPLVCRYLVDEDLESWLDVYTWMISLSNYTTLHSNGWDDGVLPKFITLHILDNTKTKIVMSIHYHGAWPSDLGELEYTYTDEGDPAITCMVNFQYKYFLVEKDGVIIETRKSIKDYANMNGKSAN